MDKYVGEVKTCSFVHFVRAYAFSTGTCFGKASLRASMDSLHEDLSRMPSTWTTYTDDPWARDPTDLCQATEATPKSFQCNQSNHL